MSEISKAIGYLEGRRSYNTMWASQRIIKYMDRATYKEKKADALVLAAKVKRKDLAGKTYMTKLLELMRDIGNPVDVNRIFNQLLEADEAKMLAIIVQTHDVGMVIPISDPLPPHSTSEDETLLTRVVNNYRNLRDQGKILTNREFFIEIGTYFGAGADFLGWNAIAQASGEFPYTFGCAIGGYPLAHVQEIEIARSGKVLKFRATGSIFLANQEGSLDAVVIECLILPNELVFTLMSLWRLFLYGKGEVKEIKNLPVPLDTTIAELRGKVSELTAYDPNLQKPSYEFHRTFPFVSRHVIIPNIFIETFSFEDRIVDGKDVIRCSILCRTYRRPKVFRNYATTDKATDFFGANPTTDSKAYAILDLMINTAWRLRDNLGIAIDERSWKTGVDPANQDDVYYNIEAQDIAQSFSLGVWGITA